MLRRWGELSAHVHEGWEWNTHHGSARVDDASGLNEASSDEGHLLSPAQCEYSRISP